MCNSGCLYTLINVRLSNKANLVCFPYEQYYRVHYTLVSMSSIEKKIKYLKALCYMIYIVMLGINTYSAENFATIGKNKSFANYFITLYYSVTLKGKIYQKCVRPHRFMHSNPTKTHQLIGMTLLIYNCVTMLANAIR